MTKNTYIITLAISISLLILSCFSDGYSENPPYTIYRFFQDKEIVLDESEFLQIQIVNGNKTVFQYLWVDPEDEGEDDGWGSETLIFQIENDLDSFQFEEDELRNIKCYYLRISAFEPAPGPHNVQKGYINGKKIDDSAWQIELDVTVTIKQYLTEFHFRISEVFRIEEYDNFWY